MADLLAILESRRDDYARAEAVVDTSGQTIEQSYSLLDKVVAPYVNGKATP
jgi:XRE family aerobic/anaerobic benzoate catabolism transcriptional regulator